MCSIQNQAPFAFQKIEQSSTPSHGSWSVPWSDLMMVMFILFLVLFIFHARDQETLVPRILFAPWEGGVSKDSSQITLDPLYERAKAIMGTDSSRVSLEYGENGDLIISLFGDFFFNPGSAELNPGAVYYLERISRVVFLAQGAIVVSGFADSSEEYENAWEISSLRAARVGQFLGSSGQLSRSKRIVVQGHGTSQPIVPASLATSSDRNRRVEVRILSNL